MYMRRFRVERHYDIFKPRTLPVGGAYDTIKIIVDDDLAEEWHISPDQRHQLIFSPKFREDFIAMIGNDYSFDEKVELTNLLRKNI
jgi:hypothetical protein